MAATKGSDAPAGLATGVLQKASVRSHASWRWMRFGVAIVLLIWLASSAPTPPASSTLRDVNDLPLCALPCAENSDNASGISVCTSPDMVSDLAACPEIP